MNKKNKTQLKIGIALIIFFVIFNMWFGGVFNHKFNFKDDICTEYTHCYIIEENNIFHNIVDTGKHKEEVCTYKTKFNITVDNQRSYCSQHRPKTFCEKCVDDWSYTEIERYYEPGMFSITPTGRRTLTCDNMCKCDKKTNETWEARECVNFCGTRGGVCFEAAGSTKEEVKTQMDKFRERFPNYDCGFGTPAHLVQESVCTEAHEVTEEEKLNELKKVLIGLYYPTPIEIEETPKFSWCDENHTMKQITCDCAKNTNTPCLMYCAECVDKEEDEAERIFKGSIMPNTIYVRVDK